MVLVGELEMLLVVSWKWYLLGAGNGTCWELEMLLVGELEMLRVGSWKWYLLVSWKCYLLRSGKCYLWGAGNGTCKALV